METLVLYEERDGVGWITLNRPDKLNALNRDVLAQLGHSLDLLEDGHAVVGVLRGAGRAFAAGADIEDYVGITVRDYREFTDAGRAVIDRIATVSKPVIAAVRGFALGGGFELLLACDLVVAADNARLGLPESRLGLLPGGGGTQRLPRLVGRLRANELIMTGRVLTAEEAHAWGLVNRVVSKDGLLAEVGELATAMAAQAPLPMSMAKRLVRDGLDCSLPAALTSEQDATALLIDTENAREGIAAFMAKRAPRFHD